MVRQSTRDILAIFQNFCYSFSKGGTFMTGLMVVGALTALYVLIGAVCMVEFGRRKKKDCEKMVYLSQIVLWVGVICGGIFLVISWFSALQDGSVGVAICFDAFVLVGITLVLGWKNCYIVYDDKGFTQHNIIGMQRSFTYAQLTGYRMADGFSTDIKLYACGKTITTDILAVNGTQFLLAARKGYARCNNGKVLPNVWEEKRKTQKKTGKGSFSAHVHNPGEFLAIFIMLLVFFVGMGIFCAVMIWKPVDPADCQQMDVTFLGWQIEDDDLILRSEGHEENFEISAYEKHLHGFEEIIEKCDGKNFFRIWVRRYDPDDGVPYYAIEEMSTDGVTYRSFADSTNAKREGAWLVLPIFGGMTLAFLGFSWLTYKIGCNPSKYPKWLVYAFFKKNAISF
jgi:hypothetical protein